MATVFESIRRVLVPIRREGWPFIAAFAAAALVLGWLWAPLLWPGLILAAWSAYFFRDPPRVTPLADDLVVSPADGRIAAVGQAPPPAELDLGSAPRPRVSVFMNVFDCHVNRAPVGGTVAKIAYRPGKFLNAELDKASEDNERNAVVIATARGPVAVVQIAGLVARRILCWVRADEALAPGQRIGMIRFGSRLDVYLPDAATVVVAVGQSAIAGETVIARFSAETAPGARID